MQQLIFWDSRQVHPASHLGTLIAPLVPNPRPLVSADAWRAATKKVGGRQKKMSKRSILVVDDDQSVRSYLSDFLTSCGYTVECSESGDQAMARLSAGYVPSVIVQDIVMPGINGIEVLEGVKKINPSIPVIILSGAGQIKTV